MYRQSHPENQSMSQQICFSKGQDCMASDAVSCARCQLISTPASQVFPRVKLSPENYAASFSHKVKVCMVGCLSCRHDNSIFSSRLQSARVHDGIAYGVTSLVTLRYSPYQSRESPTACGIQYLHA